MKKKIVALCLVVVIAIMAIAGASLAYLTDTDTKTNTFTVGSVKIQLNEQERNDFGGLDPFTNDKVLMPINGNVEEKLDNRGMPTNKNFVDKMVTVTNTGKSDAYIRCYFAIPTVLDAEVASNNALHFNFGRKAGGAKTNDNEWIWNKDTNGYVTMTATIGDVEYTIYSADYHQALAPNATTEQFISGVYLDSKVTMNDAGVYMLNGEELGKFEGGIKCPVFAVAVQAAGFANATEAMNAAFTATYNPFA